MTSFSEANLVKKLAELNNTQQSIQTLSLWLIHHRKHAKNIVHVWNSELRNAKNKKLTFLYLANDVLQNSKKKGPEFTIAFESYLPKAFSSANKNADEKTKASLQRLLNIWKERSVYSKNTLRLIKHGLKDRKHRHQHAPATENGTTEVRSTTPTPISNTNKKRLADKVLQHTLSEEIGFVERAEPPSFDALAKALSDLENSASSDAPVREKIAALPPEVSDISYLDKISDKLEAESFDATIEDACNLLVNYNSRLAQEITDRKNMAAMLRDFMEAQKQQQQKDEDVLLEYKATQQRVNLIREEIQKHVQNLPDLSRLPELTGGLVPLPSAGDLFNI